MAKQSRSQKIGAIGHKWALLEIQRHPHWLPRDLPEDFGVDAEAELTEGGVNGEILKLQFKSSESVESSAGSIRFSIDRKHLDYAKACRYPVVFITIDTTAQQGWYLWLQDWLLLQRRDGCPIASKQKNFTVWVDVSRTLSNGLDGELKDTAKWRGSTQLVLSLLDAMRAAAATPSKEITDGIVDLLVAAAPEIADATLDVILEEAVVLGDRLRGTIEGLKVSEQLFELIRRFGDKTSTASVDRMVRRGDSYSRTGLIALGILYDDFFEHTTSLSLADLFLDKGLPHVAYYCALREKHSKKKSLDFLSGPGDFRFAELRFQELSGANFLDKYANRGPSAILDYLTSTDST